MSVPLPQVEYYILNSMQNAYLTAGGFNIVLNLFPLKDYDKTQQWRLQIVANSPGKYYIQSVAFPDCFLSLVLPPESYVSLQKTADKCTTFSILPDGNGWHRLTHGATGYLTAASNPRFVHYSEDHANDSYRPHQTWKFIRVTQASDATAFAALNGSYRIRTFHGPCLLTMSVESIENALVDPSINITKQMANDPYQMWDITPLGGDKYKLQSKGNQLYLRSANARRGSNVAASTESSGWNLQNVGGLAWLIKVPDSNLAFGFDDYEANLDNNVVFQHSEVIPSQLWFFEKCSPFVRPKREITEGKYRVQSCGDPLKYWKIQSAPWRITDGVDGGSEFIIQYTNSSSFQMNISFKHGVNNSTIHLAELQPDGVLGCATQATAFVLAKEDTDAPGFYVCVARPGIPRKVVSSRIKKDFNEFNVYPIEDMVSGDTMQMWKFTPSS